MRMTFKKSIFSFVFLLACLLNHELYASSNSFHRNMNFSFGMVSATINENQSSLTSTDTDVDIAETEPASTAASVISFEFNYEFMQKSKRSFFAKGIVPLLSTDGSGVFMGGGGVNFYLNPLSTVFSVSDLGSSVIIIPKYRYYWGAGAGVGYLVYNTESAKKSDVFFDISLHGGGVYNFNKKWGGRGELSFGRSTGSATTSTLMKIFFGASYYL